LREGAEIREMGRGLLVACEHALFDAPTQEALALGVTPVEDRPCPHEGGGGDHKPCRLHEADPFEVCEDFGVQFGYGHQLVSGQR
jgi:hypothetical protein